METFTKRDLKSVSQGLHGGKKRKKRPREKISQLINIFFTHRLAREVGLLPKRKVQSESKKRAYGGAAGTTLCQK